MGVNPVALAARRAAGVANVSVASKARRIRRIVRSSQVQGRPERERSPASIIPRAGRRSYGKNRRAQPALRCHEWVLSYCRPPDFPHTPEGSLMLTDISDAAFPKLDDAEMEALRPHAAVCEVADGE